MAHALTGSATDSPLRTAWIFCAVFCLTAFHISAGLAQVPTPPITSSGLNTQISAPTTLSNGQTNYNITGGTRPGGGTNLFHSFGIFNVPTNNIANFLNDSGLPTSNILGRVTGGNISNIFGAIQTTNFGNANLFLMNPVGFLFGPNATVNVGGMVAFTSADYLKLADGGRFNANLNALPSDLITAAPVAAFGFLGSNPGAITIQGSRLSVTPGQSISLVGGDITVQSGLLEDGITVQPAQLSAHGGQIALASVASPGEIVAGTLDYAPNVNGQSFGALGTIQVSQKSVIDASGDGGGTVLIRGGRFVIDDSRISANVTGPTTGQFVGTPGQGIDIQVTQDAVIQNAAVLETNVPGDFPSAVSSGGVRITADRIQITGLPGSLENYFLQPFTGIRSDTQGAGSAGNVILRASGNIEITNVVNIESTSGFDSSGFHGSPTRASGNAGDVELTSTHGNILISSFVPTFAILVTSQTLNSSGNTGKVTASAPEGDMVLDGAAFFTHTQGSGGAGQVEIIAKNLFINSGFLNQDNLGSFKPGGLTVTLSGNFTMTGFSFMLTPSAGQNGAPGGDINLTAKDIVVSQGSLINSGTLGPGPGGHIKIVADTLHITDGSQIVSAAIDAFGEIPKANVTGPGGEITIQGLGGPAGSVLIDGAGSGIFTNTVGTGPGGNANIAAKSVTIQNGGTISADTSGTAPSATGGSITISAGQLALNSGGSITASSSGPANAGTVTVRGLPGSASAIVIDGAGSSIFTNTQGTGAGGNIFVNADSVTLQNGGTLSASSTGQVEHPGNAGNIEINATNGLTMQSSTITTQAGQGAGGGNIKVTTAPSATVLLQDSLISASVADGHGGGGNISIDPQFVILQNSQILAQAAQGQGGAITIIANLFLPDANSIVNADSGNPALNGTVTIQSPNAPASGKIQPLGKSPLQATSLLNQHCASLAGGEFSSFTVAGRDSLPTEPGNWLASPLALATLSAGTGIAGRGEGLEGITLGASLADETTLLPLRQIAPPGFLTQAFALDWSAGCKS